MDDAQEAGMTSRPDTAMAEGATAAVGRVPLGCGIQVPAEEVLVDDA